MHNPIPRRNLPIEAEKWLSNTGTRPDFCDLPEALQKAIRRNRAQYADRARRRSANMGTL